MASIRDWFGRARREELSELARARLAQLGINENAASSSHDASWLVAPVTSPDPAWDQNAHIPGQQAVATMPFASARQAVTEGDEGPISATMWWSPARRPAVIVVLMVVLVAVALGGFGVWRLRTQPDQFSVVHDGASADAEESPASTELVVAVSGSVHNPGLVRVPADSRVADAIDAAGGILPSTDMGTLNLARKLRDGELIIVGPAPPGTSGDELDEGGNGALLDLNTATAKQIEELPGIGPVLAERIVDYRTSHGGFQSVDELRSVDGIGPTRFDRLRELVTV